MERRGTIPSPNIWGSPEIYEVENLAVDREGVLDAAFERVCGGLSGRRILDVGCGTGFHLPRLARDAAWVLGLEPHLPLLPQAAARVAGARRIGLLAGNAEALPLPDRSVDVVHARWAYFFGAGCEPGLAEAARVLHPGGTIAIADHDARRSTFGGWFRSAYPAYDPVAVQRFWDRRGFATEPLTVRWTFDSRADLAAVLGIELPPAAVERALAEHPGLVLDVGVALRWRRCEGERSEGGR